MKPSFVAPAQTLEKSLREHIRASERQSKKKGKTKVKESSIKKQQRRSPTPQSSSAAAAAVRPKAEAGAQPDVEASSSSTSLAAPAEQPEIGVDPAGLSITDEEKERLRSRADQEPSRPPRPFYDAIFSALDCRDGDYVALFALCLIYAMQRNAGEPVRDLGTRTYALDTEAGMPLSENVPQFAYASAPVYY